MDTPRHAIVIGAGIVGICCAIELRRRGLQVTVVDRLEPGQGCSFGNAGILAAQAVVPIGLPGLARQLPRMLFDGSNPLTLRAGSLPHSLPWLWRLQQASSIDRVMRIADAMKALYGSTLLRHQALAAEAGTPSWCVRRPACTCTAAPPASTCSTGWPGGCASERGAQVELLEGAALREAEPALSADYVRGVRMGPMGCCVNPLRLVQAYAALLQRMGGTLRRAEVNALQPGADGVQLHIGAEALQADAVVVAAGAWSGHLLRPLGLKLPLIAERGYHLTYGDSGIRLNHVVTDIEAHFAVTDMEMGLRVAGTEELGVADDAPDWRRAEALQRHAQRLFPTARLQQGSRWMGPRPGLPDSLPAIGAVPGQSRIFVATGHGHLGLTGAPHTGQLVAELVIGTRPSLSLDAYAPGRFAG